MPVTWSIFHDFHYDEHVVIECEFAALRGISWVRKIYVPITDPADVPLKKENVDHDVTHKRIDHSELYYETDSTAATIASASSIDVQKSLSWIATAVPGSCAVACGSAGSVIGT